MSEQETFLRRWSRRKALARREDEHDGRRDEAGAPPAEALDDRGAAPPAVAPDARAEAPPGPGTAAAELPAIDSLSAESDFTAFMREGVPEELRTAALRRLWRTSPTLANLDGLVDYGEDFTNKARVVEGLKTAYRVGRGFLRDDPATPPTARAEPGESPGAVAAAGGAEAGEGAGQPGDGAATDEEEDAPRPSAPAGTAA